jgi:copper resistance protein B
LWRSARASEGRPPTIFLTAVAVALGIALASPLPAAAQQPPAAGAQDQAGHDHPGPQAPAAGDEHDALDSAGQAGLPPITDADRSAAFPALDVHHRHGKRLLSFVLFDQIEWQGERGTHAFAWDSSGWLGGDRQRVWFRTEGAVAGNDVDHAQAEVLYGRPIARWWDLVAGFRQDARPGSPQAWAAAGIQGLAPYWFQVEATAYVGASGRTRVHLDTEYDVLLTNRLVLQPHLDVEVAGKADPARGVGAGLSTGELGLRLRYELRRELAPYAGVVWRRTFFGTREHAEAAGERAGEARFVVGLRAWF